MAASRCWRGARLHEEKRRVGRVHSPLRQRDVTVEPRDRGRSELGGMQSRRGDCDEGRRQHGRRSRRVCHAEKCADRAKTGSRRGRRLHGSRKNRRDELVFGKCAENFAGAVDDGFRHTVHAILPGEIHELGSFDAGRRDEGCSTAMRCASVTARGQCGHVGVTKTSSSRRSLTASAICRAALRAQAGVVRSGEDDGLEQRRELVASRRSEEAHAGVFVAAAGARCQGYRQCRIAPRVPSPARSSPPRP